MSRQGSTQANRRKGAQVGAGYTSSGWTNINKTRAARVRKVGISIDSHHSMSRMWWIAMIVGIVLMLLIGSVTLIVCFVDVFQKEDHSDWVEDYACADSNQCSIDVSRKISGVKVCNHFPAPPGTPCESVCFEGNDHVCVNPDDECHTCVSCQGSVCKGECRDDSDCPDIEFTTGFLWDLAEEFSDGAFGFNKFCYQGMCIYEHDSAVLPLLPEDHSFECTSSPIALAFSDGTIKPSDNLSTCLVPSVVCRGRYDDQIRVDSVFHTFACSNATLPLIQLLGSTP